MMTLMTLMTRMSTVFVPVQPTTHVQTNPTIYGTVVNPGASGICFTTDPTLGTPIDEASYDAEILDWARTRVAEAMRACAGVVTPQAGTGKPRRTQ